MFLFGRKKKSDDFDEEELEEGSKSSKSKRKGSRRKKDKPKKPWGKTERLLVLTVLILTVSTSAFLALSSRAWKAPGIPRLKAPDFNLPFLSEETIILEGRGEGWQKAEKVKADFTSQATELSGVWGLYIVRLNSGFTYGVNENEIFQAASLIKLPVMVGMYKEAEAGNLDLEQIYILKNSDKLLGSGSLNSRPAGYEVTYRGLIKLMGKESDNTAFNIARNYLGDEKINDILSELGMSNTSLQENETTPAEIGQFFEDLWLGNIINDEHREELLGYLTKTAYEAWLAEGIPQDVRVAHKYGAELHVVNDAGIVYADELSEPLVIVILSKGVVEREANEAFPSLVKNIYEIEVNK